MTFKNTRYKINFCPHEPFHYQTPQTVIFGNPAKYMINENDHK